MIPIPRAPSARIREKAAQKQHQEEQYESEVESGASFSRPSKKIKRSAIAHKEEEPLTDEGDEEKEKISTLLTLLQEGREINLNYIRDSIQTDQRIEELYDIVSRPLDDDISSLKDCGMKISILISKNQHCKMVGYFFRGRIAHSLKGKYKNTQYAAKMREILGIKSRGDHAAYPAFYSFVLQYYPNLPSSSSDLLRVPIFSADISWHGWRSYLSNNQLHLRAAMDRFLNSQKDWMERDWIEIFDHPQYGQGIRAKRDIPYDASTKEIAGDYSILPKSSGGISAYSMTLKNKGMVDCSDHWLGKLNHLPDPLCNMKVTSTGKLIPLRSIAAEEELTIDYGVDYWVYAVTGYELDELLSDVGSRTHLRNLFDKMHSTTSDYSALLALKLTAETGRNSIAFEEGIEKIRAILGEPMSE